MTKLDTLSISFQSKEYLVAIIPDIISDGNHELFIGPQSLNNALYNDAIGYSDSAASDIDEKIYAYIEDDYFSLSFDDFLKKVNYYLD